MKLNWRCNICGMSAGRRTSVQRHIDNPNIHNGNGRAVPLAQHRNARGWSIDRSRTVPQITSSERSASWIRIVNNAHPDGLIGILVNFYTPTLVS
jgi:hypothetical protein